jgi:hypothetical protein
MEQSGVRRASGALSRPTAWRVRRGTTALVKDHPRAARSGPVVQRTPVPGACPQCGEEDLAEYPVLSTGGWFLVVKCQRCLASLRRVPWHRLGYVDREHARRLAASAGGTAP